MHKNYPALRCVIPTLRVFLTFKYPVHYSVIMHVNGVSEHD